MHGRWSPARDLGEAVAMPALQTASHGDNCCRIQLVIFLRSLLPPPHTAFTFTKNYHINISLYHWVPLVSKLPFFAPLFFGGSLVLCLGFVLPMLSQTIHPCCPPAIQLVSSCLPLEIRGHCHPRSPGTILTPVLTLLTPNPPCTQAQPPPVSPQSKFPSVRAVTA